MPNGSQKGGTRQSTTFDHQNTARYYHIGRFRTNRTARVGLCIYPLPCNGPLNRPFRSTQAGNTPKCRSESLRFGTYVAIMRIGNNGLVVVCRWYA